MTASRVHDSTSRSAERGGYAIKGPGTSRLNRAALLRSTKTGFSDWGLASVGAPVTIGANGGRIIQQLQQLGRYQPVAGEFGPTVRRPQLDRRTLRGGSGGISGSAGVSVNSPGYSLTLFGSNPFSGGLVMNAGTVFAGSGPALGTLSNRLEFRGGRCEPSTALRSPSRLHHRRGDRYRRQHDRRRQQLDRANRIAAGETRQRVACLEQQHLGLPGRPRGG